MNTVPPNPDTPRHDASDYMHWAKTLQAARFNLGNSGVAAVTLRELGASLDDLEVSGPSFYGWPPLLEALARHLGVGTDRVCHAEGTSLANYLAMAVLVRPGDEVLIEEPTYELLVDAARHLGASVRRFPRPRSLAFQPDLDALAGSIGPRTRLIVLSDLHNPSSARLAEGVPSRIADLAASVGARVLIDEVYLDAAAVAPPPTAHRIDPRIITTGSLTKVYGLSGLRCGWVVAEPELIGRMWRLNDLLGVIPAHSAERLSLVALRELPRLRARAASILDPNREAWNAFLARRTDRLDGTPHVAGTVVFPRLQRGSVATLCDRLRALETTVTPGAFFSEPEAFRVGLGCRPEIFAEGLERLGKVLDSLD